MPPPELKDQYRQLVQGAKMLGGIKNIQMTVRGFGKATYNT